MKLRTQLFLINFAFIFLISCTGESKKMRREGDYLKSEIQNILDEINYKTNVQLRGNTILIQGKEDFTDDSRGNVFLMNYLIHRFYQQNPDFDAKKMNIVIKYPNIEHLRSLKKSKIHEKATSRYWKFVRHALANLTVYDCVYYDLTAELCWKQTNYQYKGDIWQLIAAYADNEPNADLYFLSFYNWSKEPYDEDLKFDQRKLDFFVKESQVDYKKINEDYIDSLYQSRGFGAFRK